MTAYCQHTFRLRLVRPGEPETVSERPRNRASELFTDGLAGTQVEIPDDVQGFDLDFALATGAIAPLPCAEHPGEAKGGAKSG